MKYVVSFVVFAVMMSCHKKVENLSKTKISVDTTVTKTIASNPVREEPKDTVTVRFSKTLMGNGYSYTLEARKGSNDVIHFKSLNIFNNKNLHQKISIDTVSVLNENEVYFDVSKDANFDGYNDLEVMSQVGNYWSSSSFWLYNKKTKKYDHYKPMDTIINPEIDSKNKLISSQYHVGPVDYYYKVYEWKKNKLVMTSFRADKNAP